VDAEGLTTLFVREIFPLHGLPLTIISGRGPQFASRFWKHLCSCLSIDPRLSTAFHPQTDGRMERMNATMEQYLRAYINYQQDDWVKYLPMAEFAANNQTSETTGLSPFYGTYGLDPRISYELGIRVDNPEEVQAQLVAERLQAIHEVLRTEMAYAQQRRHVIKTMLTVAASLPPPTALKTASGWTLRTSEPAALVASWTTVS